MLPEWDIRRGRIAIHFRHHDFRVEISAGKTPVVSGLVETEIRINGESIEPTGGWETSCEYTDDDVHYLEFEQPHQKGFVLQRQVMLIREDRVILFADAVIVENTSTTPEAEVSDAPDIDSLPKIEYDLRMPLPDAVEVEAEPETTELFLSRGRKEAMVLPLSAGEWRSDMASMTHLQSSDDQHLLLSSRGTGQLFVPLWFDLTKYRFPEQRTWRNLTVAEQLKIVPDRLAAAFRVQSGAEQWFLYRSMAPPAPRTFFGKHLIADFYCARFDADDRSYEDLITVEDTADERET